MNFKIGDTVKYEFMDGEEGRSYGWFRNTAQAKVVSICYKLDNGQVIEEKKLTLVTQKANESKSDPPKQQ